MYHVERAFCRVVFRVGQVEVAGDKSGMSRDRRVELTVGFVDKVLLEAGS